MDQSNMGQKCACPHHKMVPVFLFLLGLVFLLNALGYITNHATEITWPVIIMLIGLQKMFSGYCKCCSK